MAKLPAKNLINGPKRNANARPQTKVQKQPPRVNDISLNEERDDVIPAGNLPIEWPEAPGTDHFPINVTKK